MDTNYSLSDIKSALGSTNDLSGGGFLILIILFLLLGGNFNNGWNRGNSDFGQYATAASQQEILFGQQFQNLDNKIDRIGNGIADATFALNNSVKDGTYTTTYAVKDGMYATTNAVKDGTYTTTNAVKDGVYTTTNAVKDTAYATTSAVVSEGRSLQSQLAECCCANKEATAQVRYDMANFAAAINSNIDNKFASLEKAQLQAQINAQAAQINQLQMQAQLCGIPRVNNSAWGTYPYTAPTTCGGCGCANV